MERAVSESEREEDSDRIILGLLNSVEQDGARSQRQAHVRALGRRADGRV